MKIKLDYFRFVLGIIGLAISVWYASTRAIDFYWFIYFILGLMLLFKSYYQERMSILNWLKKRKRE